MMNMERLPVWTMVATPFVRDGLTVCEPSLRNMTREVLSRGCTGVIGLGVIAEPSTLSLTEKLESLAVIVDSAGPSPVIAGALTPGAHDTSNELRAIGREFGAALEAVLVPVISPDPAEVRKAVVDAHRATGLPVLLQDLPSANGIFIEIDDLCEAISGLELLYGIKCECPPTFLRIRRLRESTNTRLMSGFGGIGLVDDLMSGADAVAAGISLPEVAVKAVTLVAEDRRWEARSLIGSYAGLINFETQARTSVAIRKEHWRRQGVIANSTVRSPSLPYIAEFDEHSRDYGFVCRTPQRHSGVEGSWG